MYRNLRYVLFAFLVGCSTGGGLRGCSSEGTVPFQETSTNVVNDSVHTVLTSAGVDFIYENREEIISMLFNVDESGWANVELSPFERPSNTFSFRTRDVSLGLELRNSGLNLEIFPDPLRIRVQAWNTRLRFNGGVVSIAGLLDGACRLGNGVAPDTPQESFAAADITLVIAPSIDAQGLLEAQVSIESLNLHAINIDLIHDPSLPECRDARCEAVCSAGELGASFTEALYAAFQDQITGLLTPLFEMLINDRIREFSAEPLKFEGVVTPDSLPESIPLPRDSHPLQLLVKPAAEGLTYVSGGADNPGIGISLDIGADAVDHPCVPVTVGEPAFSVGPRPTLSGLDPNGEPFHLGMSLANGAINRLLWSTWRAGFLCLTLDSETLKSVLDRDVNSETLSIFLPSLSALADSPKPIMVVIDPQFSKASFPLARFKAVADDQGIPQAGLSIQMPNLGIDMYAYLNERWTRLTNITTDVALDMVIQATPDNRLILAGDAPNLENLVVHYNELLETDDVPALLRAMIDIALGAFLSDGLNFDIGLTGLINGLTGLPYDARIAAMSIGGQSEDHLGIYLKIEPFSPPNALRAATDTRADLAAVAADRVQLEVAAPGASGPLYQWRFKGGTWRPLTRAENSRLVIEEPRLRLDIPQTLMVRAVQAGEILTMDKTPVEVAIPRASDRNYPHLKSLVRTTNSGCNTTPGQRGIPAFGLLLLFLFGKRRIRRFKVVLWVLLLLPFGCNDQQAAPDIPCEQNAQCPQGLICIQNICRPEMGCQDDGECCALQTCQANICRPSPTNDCENSDCGENRVCQDNYCFAKQCTTNEDCNQARCVEGHCVSGTPCEGACQSDEACYVHRNICRTLGGSCAQSCGPGQVNIVMDPEGYSGPVCSLDSVQCRCEDALGGDIGSVARDADMTLLDGQPIFVSFDSFYGDLVLITGANTNTPQHLYLDGFPTSAGGLEPSLSRHGQTAPGPLRGLYPQIEADPMGRLHVAYYDVDARSLRYMRRDEDGRWGLPIVVDQGGDVGRYVQLRTDEFGRPHLVYTVLVDTNGFEGLRYAVGSNAAENTDHFEITVVSEQRTQGGAPVAPGLLPKTYGVRPCFNLDGSSAVIAFLDGQAGWMYLARGNQQGFQVHRLSGQFVEDGIPDPGGRYADFNRHQIGEHCAILARDGLIELVFTDERTWALLGYRGPVEGGGTIQVVDQGAIGSRTRVGASVVAARDTFGRMVIVYQDSTNNDLLLNLYTATGWLVSPVVVDGNGAIGYANSVAIQQSQALIGSVQFRTAQGGREKSEVQVYSIDLSSY